MQEEVKQGRVSVHHIPTQLNIADMLTKPLPKQRFETLRDMIGLHPWMATAAVACSAVVHAGAVDVPESDALMLRTSAFQSEADYMWLLVTAILGALMAALVFRGWKCKMWCRPRTSRTVGTQSEVTWTGLRDVVHPRFMQIPRCVSHVEPS